MSEPQPLTLSYDNYSAAKDPASSRRVLPAYWLGSLTTGFLYALIATPIYLLNASDPLSPWINGLLPIGFTFVFLFPDTLFLGLVLWLRSKFLKHSRFARFRTAMITGFIAGLYPISILQLLETPPAPAFIIFLGGLAWHTLFPLIAGLWLCYPSNLRD